MNRMIRVGAVSITPTITRCAVATMREVGAGASEKNKWEMDQTWGVKEFPINSWNDLTAPVPGKNASCVEIFFNEAGSISAVSISIFGRVDTDKAAFLGSSFPGWFAETGRKYSFADLLPSIAPSSIFVHNDSTIDAVAEFTAQMKSPNASERYQDMVYLKVDFGVGAGVILKGRPWQGGLHPEPGHHAAIRHSDDKAVSVCGVHMARPCIMGLASLEAVGEKLKARGKKEQPQNDAATCSDASVDTPDPLDNVHLALDKLDSDDLIWQWEADYLAQLCMLMTSSIAPRWIVLGGRVLRTKEGKPRTHLYQKIRDRFAEMNGDFPQYWEGTAKKYASIYIQQPKWEHGADDQSLYGAFEIIREKLNDSSLDVPEAKKRIANIAKPASFKLFGLIVDDRIQWVSAGIKDRFDIASVRFSSGEINIDTNKPFQHELRSYLVGLKNQNPELFSEVSGIGVSSIGVIDASRSTLVSIARKNWLAGSSVTFGEHPYLVSFEELFQDLFTDNDQQPLNLRTRLAVQNDASAKALAEYFTLSAEDRRSTLLYLMFNEGVNGGIIRANESLTSERHPEMGHIIPFMHGLDYKGRGNFALSHTGCPAHKICFEGLASRARLRNSWRRASDGKPLESMTDLLGEPNHLAWKIIPFYVAQLCMIGLLTVGPAKIRLSGSVLDDKGVVIDKARDCFMELNNGYLPHLASEQVQKFISKARLSWEDAEARSALIMAWLGATGNKQESYERSANVRGLHG